jgi:hypothetical protein
MRWVKRRLAWVLFGALALAGLPLVYAQAPQQQPFSQRWPAGPVQLHPAKTKAAQHRSAKPHHSAAKPEHPAKQPEAKLPVSLEQALYLIRSTLLTLNDANRSGNYTVLHDLAAPAFQAKNTAADLARIFADLRQRRIDLYAVALTAPRLSAAPHLESNGMLRLTGVFPTHPLQIKFDLLFQDVGKQWRLFGISIGTPPAPAAVGQHGDARPQAKR